MAATNINSLVNIFDLNNPVMVGLFSGNGSPDFKAAKGSLYIQVDATTTTTRLWINTDGNTTWANFTASA